MEKQIMLSAPVSGSECTVTADCTKAAVYVLEFESTHFGLWHSCHDHVTHVLNAAMLEALND